MGVSRLKEIATLFENARSPFEPMAVIQNATLPEQKVAIGMACTICKQAQENEIGSPAVIVIGKVVNERELVDRLITGAEVSSGNYVTQRTI
jgi:uroporphyrin-III C-methyltransferase